MAGQDGGIPIDIPQLITLHPGRRIRRLFTSGVCSGNSFPDKPV